MSEFQEQLLFWFQVPIYAIFIPLELILSSLSHRSYYRTWKETAMNIYLTLVNAGVNFLLRAVSLFVLLFFAKYALPIDWNPIAYWIALFVLEDLMFWVEHYVDHNVRLFWASHVTHHSSEEYNLTTGFRSSVFMPLYRFMYFIPLALLGFKPIDILFMYAITQIYGILVHTQYIKSMPKWFEYIFVSPSHHRVHHASNIPYLDKNMGMALIIWDRMFGTFAEELPDEKPVYGLVKPLENPHHPVKVIFHEWESIGAVLKSKLPFSTKLKYLFNPPGWSHDGSTKTAKELRKEWFQQRKKAQ